MGSIKDLNCEIRVHLLYTKSNLAEIFVYDSLKSSSKGNADSVIAVTNKKELNQMFELINVQPFMAEKWLFVIEYEKVKASLKDKYSVFSAETCIFLVKVKSYKEFKEFKNNVSDSINELYLARLNFYDADYLLRNLGLSNTLIEFACKSYCSEPDKLFLLRGDLLGGRKFEKRKDIVDCCGESASSIQNFIFYLLKDKPPTEKGRNLVYRRKVVMAKELSNAFGISTFRNFLVASVKDILDIKQLHMMGVIYNKITDIPSVYDEKKLSRYNFYLDKIISIDYNSILRLYLELKKEKRWYKDIDMLMFLYEYQKKGV